MIDICYYYVCIQVALYSQAADNTRQQVIALLGNSENSNGKSKLVFNYFIL